MKKNVRKKNEIIKKWNDKVPALTERSKVLEESIDQQEQYSRQNCLLIHSVEENSNEDTDKLAWNIINNDLEIDLTEIAIDCTHHIGDQKKEKEESSAYNSEICEVLWPKTSFFYEETFKRKRYFVWTEVRCRVPKGNNLFNTRNGFLFY